MFPFDSHQYPLCVSSNPIIHNYLIVYQIFLAILKAIKIKKSKYILYRFIFFLFFHFWEISILEDPPLTYIKIIFKLRIF